MKVNSVLLITVIVLAIFNILDKSKALSPAKN